jgi:hypothetical protein
MVDSLTVNPLLADSVEKELLSIKPTWQYVGMTNYFYDVSDPGIRSLLNNINAKYGPVVDTQRFTDEYVNRFAKPDVRFINIRSNPNSRYNKHFPNVARLVDYIQTAYIPKEYAVYRLMTNIQTIRPKWTMNAPHPDTRLDKFITVLYYVNDSDGDTFFFDGDECISRVKPIKGTAAMYPSNTWHAGSTPVEHETRVVINMVFGPNK